MDVSVSARELFREFVVLAMRSCQQAEKACPRTGPGRKPVVPDWVIATLIVVALADHGSAWACLRLRSQRSP